MGADLCSWKFHRERCAVNQFCGRFARELCSLGIDRWTGPFPAELRAQAVDALENGKVLVFPQLPFAFEEQRSACCSRPLLSNGKSKNVSLKGSGELGGTAATGEDRASRGGNDVAVRTRRDALCRGPGAAICRPARTRAHELSSRGDRGRPASVIHDDTRLHVDAFPSRPMRGRRIMRLFTNVNPEGHPRVWHVGEPFEDMAKSWAIARSEGSQLHAWVLSAMGVTKGLRSAL